MALVKGTQTKGLPPRSPAQAALMKARQRLNRDYKKRSRELFSKSDVIRAQSLVTALRQEYHETNLKAGPGREAIAKNAQRFRRRASRELRHALPGYREFQRLLRERRRAFKKLGSLLPTRETAGNFNLSLSQGSPFDAPTVQSIATPYPLIDRDHYIVLGEVDDASTVEPETGFLIQRYDFQHDDDGPLSSTIFGDSWPETFFATTGCGANFRINRSGRLRVIAELQNFYCQYQFSVEDLFGFSETEFEISVCAYFHIESDMRKYHHFIPLVSSGLTSFGVDLAFALPGLDNTRPYFASHVSDEQYDSGQLVKVAAGAALFIHSDVNDMRSRAHGFAGWRLNRLGVEILPG